MGQLGQTNTRTERYMTFRSFIFCAAIALIPAAAMAQPTTTADGRTQVEGIAAIVNDEPISFSDVRQRATLLMMGLGQQPTEELQRQLLSQALEQLIDEIIQIQEAAEFEVVIGEEEIAAAIGDMAAQSNVTREQLFSQLASIGVSPTSLEQQMRAEIGWRRIMGGLYGSRIRISPNQIDDQIARLKRSAAETQYQVSEIFLYTSSDDEKEQAKAAAQSLLTQLREGAPFQLAAQRFSSAPTAATGGDMGWITPDTLDTPLRAALEALPGPGIAEPIEVENGVYLLAVRSKREPADQTPLVDLRQLVATDNSEDTLTSALAQIRDGCDGIDEVADADANLTAVKLGQIKETDLNPEMQTRVASTEVGEGSAPYSASAGIASIFVCARAADGAGIPSRDQIENTLYGRQLGMVSERALRDLKREATIIRR